MQREMASKTVEQVELTGDTVTRLKQASDQHEVSLHRIQLYCVLHMETIGKWTLLAAGE